MQFGRQVRNRFPLAEKCRCSAEGVRTAPEQLSLRVMNFGQHWRGKGVRDWPYTVEMPVDYFLVVLREQLPEYIEAAKEDRIDGPLDEALLAAGWPSADEAVRDASLAQALAEEFALRLLEHWLGDGPPEQEPGYILNTIDRVDLLPDRVRVSGTCRRTGSSSAYQD
jgi:hypothetical protein